jgi:hypothetical protein
MATAARPALLTFAQRPSEWDGMAVDIAVICISVNQNISKIRTFFNGSLTAQFDSARDLPVGCGCSQL